MGLRGVVSKRLGLLFASVALAAGIAATATPAEARHRHRHYAHHHHHVRASFHVRRFVHIRRRHGVRLASAVGGPPKAEIVVDANSGQVLFAHNENELRHPASLTKVMTLYLLFEQLQKGRLKMSSELTVSAHAAAQAPTKLGLRPGSEIAVEGAIKAIVTRSANDMAVTVAEAIGGSEPAFADMMTRKAHALGMSRTHYANASGLPNADQLTTAHDLAILGRAIQDRFPQYFHFFSIRSARVAGKTLLNHNHLMDRIEGMDGIKTGYTNASGFNLLSDVRRDGHHIVGVVLGGRSARARDQLMAGLIDDHIDEGARGRTAVAIAEHDDDEAPAPVAEAAPVREPAREPVRLAAYEPARVEPARVEPVREPVRAAESDALQLGVPPAPVAVERNREKTERPRPAYVAGAARPTQAQAPADKPVEKIRLRAARTPIVTDGSTSRRVAQAATSTPSTLRWVTGAQPARRPHEAAAVQEAKVEGKTEVAKAKARNVHEQVDEEETTASIRSGWIIQIGATDDIAKAKDLLSRAKGRSHAVARARAFTEKVQKGKETLYRARFAGLQEASAESACRELKRSGFACFTMKN